MIIREIAENPNEVLRTFDWFNDYEDTRWWITRNCPGILPPFEAGFKEWRAKMVAAAQKANMEEPPVKVENKYEKACKEWLKGCSCSTPGKQQQCTECTDAFFDHLRYLASEDGYSEVDSNTVAELSKGVTPWKIVSLSGTITPSN